MCANIFTKNKYTDHTNSINQFENMDIFKQFQMKEITSLQKNKPNIDKILTSIIDPEVYSMSIFNTIKGESFEGKNLTGKKLCIVFKIRKKILYVADLDNQSVHATENISFVSTSLSIPNTIEGSCPEILVKNNFFIPNIYIEDSSIKKLNDRIIINNLHICLSIKIIPTYSLCLNEYINNKKSNLFLLFKNGARKKQLTDDTFKKCILPKWSPCGQKIAFLSNKEDTNLLYLSTLSGNLRKLSLPNYIEEVIDFCWGKNSSIIYVSARSFEGLEIYALNIFNQKCTRLTFSHHKYMNKSPKYHCIANKLIFKKIDHHDSDLYAMNEHGLHLQQLTHMKNIKSFDCSKINSLLTYITEKDMSDTCQNTICLFDLSQNKSQCIFQSNYFIIKKVKFSHDSRYLAFILWDYDIYNLYIYDLQKDTYDNYTHFSNPNMIYDLEWDLNNKNIYFSMVQSYVCNIFSLDIKLGTIQQITNSNSSKIDISYRSKIK
ncbi:TolB family protein [Inediibacterium massiliense]|uniref:TolB family protein n=1 Tax=Inediibacterium massiliense TaxID=1658111 RepID=UPI0006B5EE1A|nr:hypothetical protein [Inediibacterium massiliense]